MDHIAIMKKPWGLTKKILTGQKKIESRWHNVKYAPWNRIKPDEFIYFKDSGEPVSIKAQIKKVVQLSGLTPNKVKRILDRYAEEDGIEKKDIPRFFEMFKNKKYCILVFLKRPQKIEPFGINKTGFGMMSSWITVSSIDQIKLR